jgi:ABC-type polysaccharide/polyol phosphate transport system ATPase subunit
LGQFGVVGDMALQRIATLSGGQKSRVAFAIVTWKKPHLIIVRHLLFCLAPFATCFVYLCNGDMCDRWMNLQITWI